VVHRGRRHENKTRPTQLARRAAPLLVQNAALTPTEMVFVTSVPPGPGVPSSLVRMEGKGNAATREGMMDGPGRGTETSVWNSKGGEVLGVRR
jgi:hypothetical protein